MQESKSYMQTVLEQELHRRKALNPSYSLRAFAKHLGVSRSSLSAVMLGRRKVSKRMFENLLDGLELSPNQLEILNKEKENKDKENFIQLQSHDMSVLKDWYFFAILNLAQLDENQADAQWVADRLGLPVETANFALKTLIHLDYLEIDQGRLVRKVKPLTSSRDQVSSYLQIHHTQQLELGKLALKNTPIQERDFNFTTMTIDPEKIDEAKKRILKFKRSLARFLENGSKKEVYSLGIQLFPTRISK